MAGYRLPILHLVLVFSLYFLFFFFLPSPPPTLEFAGHAGRGPRTRSLVGEDAMEGAPVAPYPAAAAPLVPALFVLGDSTVDCGTNNFLWTLARADRLPYGRDFDTHRPTGRFSNGRIIVDYLGSTHLCRFLNRHGGMIPEAA